MSRQIVLDTETTGLSIAENNRVVEIGAAEIIDRRLTGNTFQRYINPERDSEPDALKVHGLTSEFLSDKPTFAEIAVDFVEYVRGAELIIHNAPFDMDFLNHELSLLPKTSPARLNLYDVCRVSDSLSLAKRLYPGARNSLDALRARLGVDNVERKLHGALLDAEILADVYLLMTGGQVDMRFGFNEKQAAAVQKDIEKLIDQLTFQKASPAELVAHDAFVTEFLQDRT